MNVAAVGTAIIFVIVAAISVVHGTTRFPGQWDNIPAEVREWYRTQAVPGGPQKGQSCCSLADSTHAEEDRREGHYWTKFEACGLFVNRGETTPTQQCIPVDWTEVPAEAVLQNYRPPRDVQLPVVWWYWDGQKWGIRCYAPQPDA